MPSHWLSSVPPRVLIRLTGAGLDLKITNHTDLLRREKCWPSVVPSGLKSNDWDRSADYKRACKPGRYLGQVPNDPDGQSREPTEIVRPSPHVSPHETTYERDDSTIF